MLLVWDFLSNSYKLILEDSGHPEKELSIVYTLQQWSCKGLACWSSTTRKEVGCPLDCYCCALVATWLC